MTQSTPSPHPMPLEMWGGVECSIVRVGSAVRDQLVLNGHEHRIEDLNRFAELGIRALRYPILWERHPDPARVDWGWADERLSRLRELGIRPIVGFIHHGCGPLPGGLLDPGFVPGLADFARRVAERYPWIDAYTPVNEPATTARFSGLYGLWHPHGNDASCFGRCFLHQCLATRAAMKAIRKVNPTAQLIQTEDIGKTHSTPRLSYQADYENERRWLTFDVLCGRIDPRHLVHAHLLECGVPAAELASFVEDPCPPDVMGMNHYVTSERFLDERLDRYPPDTHGGNGRESYADVDAVRVRAEGLNGPGALLRETWERYRRPVAITEVQLACTREEQVRWLLDVWQQAGDVRASGVDVRAVTPWALLGSFDWDTLLTEARGCYENGAFDVRSATPRLTAVGRAVASLARRGRFEHPVLQMPGWWQRPLRLEYAPVSAPTTGPGLAFPTEPNPAAPPVLVLGADGRLGQAFLRLCKMRGLPAVGRDQREIEVVEPEALSNLLRDLRPWVVINCIGFSDIVSAETSPAECRRLNVTLATNVALAAAAAQAQLLAFSTDLVFDGTSARPYVESDEPHPLGVYARSKHEAETRIEAACPAALIVRPGMTFSAWDDQNYAAGVLRALQAGQPVRAAENVVVSPTYLPDLVHTALDLLVDGETGRWHLANRGETTLLDWTHALAAAAGLPRELIVPIRRSLDGQPASRPPYTALASERGDLLPDWSDAVQRFVQAMENQQTRAAA